MAGARQAEHHARGGVELAVHGRQGGHQHHEVQHPGGVGDVDDLHHAHKGAGLGGGFGPGHDGQHQRQGQQVEQHQAQHGGLHGALHGLLGVLGLSGGHGNRFHAQVAEHGHDHAQPHAPQALGPEAAAQLVVLQPDAGNPRPEDHVAADQHKGHDGGDLDGREQVLGRAIDLHAAQVDADQQGREHAHPDPLRHLREPVGHVDADGGDLHAHGQHQRGPVGIAHHKAGQRAQVVLGIGTERARGGVGHRHLAQAADQQQGDEGADGIADQHGRAGKADGEGTAHEQTGAHGATDGDHHHLRAGQVLLQAGFAALDVVEIGHAPAPSCVQAKPASIGVIAPGDGAARGFPQ